MSDSDEAFSNTEQLFWQAFTAMDPVPILLQLLKEYPTYSDLAVYYAKAVQESPFRRHVQFL